MYVDLYKPDNIVHLSDEIPRNAFFVAILEYQINKNPKK